MLIAKAWHNRSDALSSIVGFVGIGGGLMGMPWLDILAAVFVARIIAKVRWDFAWRSPRKDPDVLPDIHIQAEEPSLPSSIAFRLIRW